MSLRDGTKKMSKSDPSDYSRLTFADDADAIAQKIRKAKTDPEPLPTEAEGLAGRPEAENLVVIYAALAETTKDKVLAEFGGSQFSIFKGALVDVAVAKLGPISAEMKKLQADPGYIDGVLARRLGPRPRDRRACHGRGQGHRRLHPLRLAAPGARPAASRPIQDRLAATQRACQHAAFRAGDAVMTGKPRRSYEAGHRPKFLVVVDETPECDKALYFAARRAGRDRGGSPDAVGDQPARLPALDGRGRPDEGRGRGGGEPPSRGRRPSAARAVAGIEPQRAIRTGPRAEEIVKLIEEDEDISLLILAAGTSNDGPGPLVTYADEGGRVVPRADRHRAGATRGQGHRRAGVKVRRDPQPSFRDMLE